MRDLKFRVWNGDYFEFSNFNFKTGCLGCNFSSCVEIDTPQQFTGSKDKNGKEIYEGDILTLEFCEGYFNDCIFIDEGMSEKITVSVEFQNGGWFYIETDGTWYQSYDVEEYCDIQVIGNIHENPKLLEDK